jgi:dolichol kinase
MYSLHQVSIFYLLLIALLSWVGFTKSLQIGSTLGMAIGDAAGSVLGALLGVFISYHMFIYARNNNLIVR